ncbi:hypothetical protein N7486_000221 [Penicillium sp. IBT 16267x]|nr:hypothetical protein N7486_000221 [Penicillium sp. IBT 16267x]
MQMRFRRSRYDYLSCWAASRMLSGRLGPVPQAPTVEPGNPLWVPSSVRQQGMRKPTEPGWEGTMDLEPGT